MNVNQLRSKWAAVGAAIAVSLGAGGIGITHATTSSGEKPVYLPIEPCRMADTRPEFLKGPRATPLGADETYTLAGWGSNGDCNLPNGTAGLALNVTALDATAPTFLTIFPADATEIPTASNLNPVPGQPPTPNAVNVDLDAAGMFSIYNLAGNVNIIVDVVGIYDDHNHDDRYYQKGEVYTKGEVDSVTGALDTRLTDVEAKVAPLVNSVAAFAGGNQLIFLAGPEEVVRTLSLMPPADGVVVVNSSVHFLEVSGGGGESVVRCSITTGTTNDYDFLQIVTLGDNDFEISAGTRAFTVTEGVLLTVNFVCDESSGEIRVQDSSLTAIFAPS